MISPPATGPSSLRKKVWSSSARPRRRRRSGARRSGITNRAVKLIPGSCALRRWSITITSTRWIETSVLSSSSSVLTFPINAKLCLNGHEYAKQQLKQKGLDFQPLDNGFRWCADASRLQRICDGLSAEKIDRLLRKWLRLLPHPFTQADRQAGWLYDISILQAEFSLTQVLDRPLTG